MWASESLSQPSPYLHKLTALPHSRGVISGAITSQYLLEKSRIVFQVGKALPYPRVVGWAGSMQVLLPGTRQG